MHGSKGVVSRVQVRDTRLLSHIYPKPPDDPQNEKEAPSTEAWSEDMGLRVG